jgi:hypothetical protein
MTNFHEPINASRVRRRRKPGRAGTQSHPVAFDEGLPARYEEQPQQDAPGARVFQATSKVKARRGFDVSVPRSLAGGLLALCAVLSLAVSAFDLLGRTSAAPPRSDPRSITTVRRQAPRVRPPRDVVAHRASAPRTRRALIHPASKRIAQRSTPAAPAPQAQIAAPAGPEEQTQGGPFSP